MQLSRAAEISRFATVGVICTVIDLSIFYLAYFALDLHILIANSLAYAIATFSGYRMHKLWTFAERNKGEVTTAEILRFVSFNLVGLMLSNFVVFLLAGIMHPMVAKLCAIAVTFTWNYLTMRRFVFNGNSPDRDSVV